MEIMIIQGLEDIDKNLKAHIHPKYIVPQKLQGSAIVFFHYNWILHI